MANQESDHSRLEAPLRPHSASSAGGPGQGPGRAGDRHTLTPDTLAQQQQKRASIVTVGTRPCAHLAGFCSSTPRTSLILQGQCLRSAAAQSLDFRNPSSEK